MPTVEFVKDFTWSPPERHGQTDIDYEAGKTYRGVRRACAEAAVKAGAGRVVEGEDGDDGNGGSDDGGAVEGRPAAS